MKSQFITLIAAGVLMLISMTLVASDKAAEKGLASPVKAKSDKMEAAKAADTNKTAAPADVLEPTAVINWYAISFGGGQSMSPNYSMGLTIGQSATGKSSSPSYIINHGFQQNFIVPNDCCDRPGDANGDESVNIGDPVYIINYIFKFGPPPHCLNEGDANGDCAINIGDPVFLINYIFKYGPPPGCGCVD